MENRIRIFFFRILRKIPGLRKDGSPVETGIRLHPDIPVEIVRVHVNNLSALPHIAQTLNLLGLLPSLSKRRKKHPREDGNHSNYHKELHKGEITDFPFAVQQILPAIHGLFSLP